MVRVNSQKIQQGNSLVHAQWPYPSLHVYLPEPEYALQGLRAVESVHKPETYCQQ